ncbi:hypothetical protein GCM10019016_079600 [Streptomyces prasinosporus]|uniref:LLM class flavin-dependent oxidoreductase n=1 Tax=Streptomyces prasinosporus TaxID=68256 RepID=A0ABP6TZN1_9ACTN
MTSAAISVTATATTHLRAGQVRMGLLLGIGPPTGGPGERGAPRDVSGRRLAAMLSH